MCFTLAEPATPDPNRLTATDLEQLRRIDALKRGGPLLDGMRSTLNLEDCARYRVIAAREHRYDAWIVGGWQTLVVFAPGGAEALAWWGDQSDGADAGPDAGAVYAAYEAALAEQVGE